MIQEKLFQKDKCKCSIKNINYSENKTNVLKQYFETIVLEQKKLCEENLFKSS